MTPGPGEALPHVAGKYARLDTAEIVRGRLMAAGLPVHLSSCDFREAPPGPVIESPDGRPAVWIPLTLWVLRTDYSAKDRQRV